jgi:diguanylate cyclase (GGDEF)-like protein
MKIDRARPASAVRSVATSAYARHSPNADTEVSPALTAVGASVLGIPEAEFTPRVRQAVMGLMQEVDVLRRQLQDTERRLDEAEKTADRDGMLPLLNRRAFVRELARTIAATGRYHTPASLIYFDLNALKHTNDTLGHAAGDAALTHFANVLQANVRDSDSVGRLGGDEFGVLLGHAGHELAEKKADALAHTLKDAPARWEGHTIPISFAYGAFQLQPGDSPDTAMARADEAMYAQKRQTKTASG